MKTLLILRHAKSSWANAGLPDHDRPLNDRGKRDAPRMGQLIEQQGLVPDMIVCSTALRARKTASKVAKACGYRGRIEEVQTLYHAYPDDCIQYLRGLSDQYESVLLVGHNPCLEDLVQVISGQYERMPTAALAHLVLGIERWADMPSRGAGRLVEVWRPKEISP